MWAAVCTTGVALYSRPTISNYPQRVYNVPKGILPAPHGTPHMCESPRVCAQLLSRQSLPLPGPPSIIYHNIPPSLCLGLNQSSPHSGLCNLAHIVEMMPHWAACNLPKVDLAILSLCVGVIVRSESQGGAGCVNNDMLRTHLQADQTHRQSV